MEPTQIKLGDIYNAINDIEYKQDAAKAVLDLLNAKDFSTETKLEAVRLLLTALEGKDYASETTLTALKTELELIKAEVNALKTIVISSADAKPVGVNGQTLIEHDTKKVFAHDGTDWREW